MKINRVWVVCDTNGEFKGLFASEELAVKAANFYGAYVSNTDVVHEEVVEPKPDESQTLGQYIAKPILKEVNVPAILKEVRESFGMKG